MEIEHVAGQVVGQNTANHRRTGDRVAHYRSTDHRCPDRRADRQQGRARRPGAARIRPRGLLVGRRAARGTGRIAHHALRASSGHGSVAVL